RRSSDRRGLRPEAKDLLRKAVALAPHVAAPRTELVFLLEEEVRAAGGNISAGHWSELENLLRRSIADSPHLAAPPLALAHCLQQEGRSPEAGAGAQEGRPAALRGGGEDLLREAVAAEPGLCSPHLALANFLLEGLRYTEAETVAAAAVQRCPSGHGLRLVLARIQLQLRRFEDAETTIEALLAVAPEDA